MRDISLRQQRDLELFKCYRKALEEHTFELQREAVDYVRTHPAPHWFVSREFCAAVISSRLRGKDHYKMGKQKRRKFDALFELYQQKRKEHPFSEMKHMEVCEAIVAMPAPEWYLEREMAYLIIKEQIKQWNQRKTKRYENW
jgi:hypothetical protein